MKEVSLTELLSTDVEELSKEQVDKIVATLRDMRARWDKAKAIKKGKKEPANFMEDTI